eukprot:g54317.t1
MVRREFEAVPAYPDADYSARQHLFFCDFFLEIVFWYCVPLLFSFLCLTCFTFGWADPPLTITYPSTLNYYLYYSTMIPSSVRAVTRKHVSNFGRSNQLGLNRSPTALAHRPTNIGLRQRHFSSDNRPHPNVPRHYRLETRSFSSLTVRQQVESWRRWLSENSPKGFKNFYSENKGNSSNNSGSSNSGGGNKKGDNFPSGSDILMGAVGFAFISWLFVNQLWSDGKEITWQQFRTKYLDQGRVMSIEVFNKELAKVTLVDSKERPYFMIGSVDSFESNLTHAQEALGVAPEDFIDVTYSGTPNLFLMLILILMLMIFCSLF